MMASNLLSERDRAHVRARFSTPYLPPAGLLLDRACQMAGDGALPKSFEGRTTRASSPGVINESDRAA